MKTSLQNRSSLKKPPVGRRKSRSISPSPEEAASALSLPEKAETEGLKEDTQGESSSYEKTDPTTKVLDVTSKPKTKRRKSFTSLLVNGSKVRNLTSFCLSCDSFFFSVTNLVILLAVR